MRKLQYGVGLELICVYVCGLTLFTRLNIFEVVLLARRVHHITRVGNANMTAFLSTLRQSHSVLSALTFSCLVRICLATTLINLFPLWTSGFLHATVLAALNPEVKICLLFLTTMFGWPDASTNLAVAPNAAFVRDKD